CSSDLILRLLDLFTFDLAGILAAVLGAGSAWLAVRQYETLSRAYTFAATELSVIHERLAHADEESWAGEVADAEEAISREHTMWRSEEHTSELQSRENLVCRLLLEKKNHSSHLTSLR